MRRSKDFEEHKVGRARSGGDAVFTNENDGKREVFKDLRRDPEDPKNDEILMATRLVVNPETNEFEHQHGRVVGAIQEASHFAWEHKIEESGVVATVIIGVALHSLYKHLHNRHT